MKAKAISFTPEVLKAKLRALEEYGRCMTRRPVRFGKFGPESWTLAPVDGGLHRTSKDGIVLNTTCGKLAKSMQDAILRPQWRKGQSVWIRERARVLEYDGFGRGRVRLRYEVDGADSAWIDVPERIVTCEPGTCIANGVFREGARHFLDVVAVRAETVAEISGDDCVLEGVNPSTVPGLGGDDPLREACFAIYDSIYGTGAHATDWCWVYTLKRAET